MSKRKKSDLYTERQTVSFTPEQMRRVEEILRVRARDGKMQHKTDLIRDALNLYLSYQDDIPGTRAAITRKLEGRLVAVEEQLGQQNNLLQQQNEVLEKLVTFFKKRRGG